MLLTQVLILQPTISKAALNSNTTSSIQSVAQPITGLITPDGPGGTEKVKTNEFRDGGLETEYTYGRPGAFSAGGSGINHVNNSYQDEVHSGTYGGYLSSRGTYQHGSTATSYRYFIYDPERSYLDEKITLDFWYNAKANPDFTLGTQIYFHIQFISNVGNHYINYYLSRVSGLPVNQTTTKHIDLRGPLDSWTNIVRNITLDFDQAFSTGADLSLTYINYLFFYSTSVRDSTGDTILLYDDVSCTNETSYNYLSINGDFELGTSVYWHGSGSGPGSVYLTEDDYTQGNRAMNMTVNIIGMDTSSYAYAERGLYSGWQSLPKGYTSLQPGDLIFSYDWKYSDVPGVGSQSAYYYISMQNETVSGAFYFFLGEESDDISGYSNYTSPTYFEYYLKVDNFGSRDTWNHFSVDFFSILSIFNLTNLIASNNGFYINGNDVENGNIQLLIDDFQLVTYPTSNPSFESNFDIDTSDPILLWQTPYNDDYVNITTDAHTGNYAVNLSSYSGYTNVYCRRNTFLPIVNNLYTDFWWRLDSMTDTGNLAYTTLRLRTDDSNYIHYVLGNNSLFSPTNDSDNCYFFVEGYNEIGSWHNIFRDLYDDVTAAFGPGNWNVTQIDMLCMAQGTEEAIVIIDDLYFVRDIEGPQFSNLLQNPANPEYGQAVDVSIDIVDNILIQDVEFYYKIGSSSWGTNPVSVVGNTFTGTIPAAGYGELAYYYFLASDVNGHVTQWGSEATPFTYVVDDFTDPVLTIEVPPEDQILNGTILFNITDAYDLGSGIASFDIIINGTSVHNETTAPATYAWDTETYDNIDYPVIFRLEDNAGNIVEVGLQYTIYNPPTGWENFKTFMQQWGPYIGGGAGALLIGILVIVIVVRRKKRIAG